MPYIPQKAREPLDPYIGDLGDYINDVGQLNYAISQLCIEFAARQGSNYAAFNATIGVLESAKLELYRRHVAPYEDIKMAENGDL